MDSGRVGELGDEAGDTVKKLRQNINMVEMPSLCPATGLRPAGGRALFYKSFISKCKS
jgi:hypothetical protein